MTYKVSLAISGAVSLGSYESGTVYEIINAIKLHNESNPDDERIEIDVLSGASAGGMTAAMIAQKLLFDADQLTDPIDNCLYDVWVNRVDISDLLNPNLGDDPNKSLLSSNRIADNANAVFLQRYNTNGELAVNPHPAASTRIHLGLALSNLNGVDYQLPTFSNTANGLQQGEYIQTRNQDRYTTEVNQSCDNAAYWQTVITAGRGCGAFPVAFRPICMERKWDCADYKGRGAKNWQPDFNGKFSYADGGIFNNYPLGMARELSLNTDVKPQDADKRFYFYISPDAKVSTADHAFDADNANILGSVGQIVKAVLSNSRFQDWVQTDQINGQLELLNERIQGLLQVVMSASDDEREAMKLTAERFCELLYKDKPEERQRDAERARIKFSPLIPVGVVLSEEQMSLWVNAILVMEVNAGLTQKDAMRIYTITADPTELASDPVFAFFGFLDKRFRHHDYLVGRLKARQTLNHIISMSQSGDTQQMPLNIPELDTSELEAELGKIAKLKSADMNDVAKETREKLYQRIQERCQLWMKDMGLNWVIRQALYRFVIRGKVRSFLFL